MDRRPWFGSTAALALGALAGCALPGVAQRRVKTPFNVPATYIPIVGGELMFPVRRVYGIGRNFLRRLARLPAVPAAVPALWPGLKFSQL